MLTTATYTRRSALQIGGLGMLGMTLPKILSAVESRAAHAKSLVFLYQFGGPSHLDTFDPKPEGPDGIRSQFGVIPTSAPGITICDQLPQTAKIMDKVTLIRSVYHTMNNHNSASYYALTGHAPPVDDIRLRDTLELFPAYGSVVSRMSPGRGEIPTFVAYPCVMRDGEVTPGQHASFFGKGHDPLLVLSDPNSPDFSLPELSLPRSITPDRLQARTEIQQLVNQQARLLDLEAARGLNDYSQRAMSMLTSPHVRNAFNISDEPQALRDRYGRTTYGQSCLLARRLVESGVKFVNVYYADTIGGRRNEDGWDTHGFDNTRMYPILKDYHLPLTDQVLPTFLNDLEDRGLLDSTLVVWMGEFGRTPKINANISRDHWPKCYTVLLAGGGVKRGYVHGASDKQAAYPDRDPVLLDDLAATMFAALGIDPHHEVMNRLNRPVPLSAGKPVWDVFA